MFYKLPHLLTPQPEGGFTVTCPLLPELITEADSLEEVLENAKDAFEAVLETSIIEFVLCQLNSGLSGHESTKTSK